jgi:hypothetical protein
MAKIRMVKRLNIVHIGSSLLNAEVSTMNKCFFMNAIGILFFMVLNQWLICMSGDDTSPFCFSIDVIKHLHIVFTVLTLVITLLILKCEKIVFKNKLQCLAACLLPSVFCFWMTNNCSLPHPWTVADFTGHFFERM